MVARRRRQKGEGGTQDGSLTGGSDRPTQPIPRRRFNH